MTRFPTNDGNNDAFVAVARIIHFKHGELAAEIDVSRWAELYTLIAKAFTFNISPPSFSLNKHLRRKMLLDYEKRRQYNDVSFDYFSLDSATDAPWLHILY